MKTLVLNIFLILGILQSVVAQETDSKALNDNTPLQTGLRFGGGFGIPNGGVLGVQASALLNQNIEVFAGFGSNLHQPSANAGISIILQTKKNIITPKLLATYGNNGIIVIEKKNTKDVTSYYHFSAGLLFEIRLKPESKHYLSFGALYAMRSEKFRNDWDELKKDPKLTVSQKPSYFLFSLSYHFHIYSF
jgi:hypothetical protein